MNKQMTVEQQLRLEIWREIVRRPAITVQGGAVGGGITTGLGWPGYQWQLPPVDAAKLVDSVYAALYPPKAKRA